jgi:hypothetical protein
MRRKLPTGTKARFNIANGLHTGIATIADIDTDNKDGHTYYKLADVQCSQEGIEMHCNKDEELWVNDYELRPIALPPLLVHLL